jgi:3-oxoacyl-[acyl-carrier protein] reductase
MTRAVAQGTSIDYDALKEAAAERAALRRTGRPDDIAGVISFLCSEEASFVTGQTLYATGSP